MATYQVIGKRIPRVDGFDKTTGAAVYTGDTALPGMLWGKTVRSPYPHARILSIDTSEAKKVPGVVAVLTAADVSEFPYGRALKDIPVLARDRVRHVGERVAAVVAETEDAAERAVDLIDVEYEELPAVFDPVEAAAPDAPILHPDFNNYPGVRRQLEEPSNAFARADYEKGDIEQGFAEADVISEHTYHTQDRHAVYLEPQGVIVWDDPESQRVHIWVSNSKPYRLRAAIPRTFGIDEEKIVFHPTYVGGDFGSKSLPANMAIAYFLSKASGGRPVKMVHDYVEELLAGNPNKSMVYTMKTGVKRDGTITALQVTHYVSCGAYAGYSPGGGLGGAHASGGPYKVPNVKFNSRNVYTNTLPAQIMRAPGEEQAVYAIECHLDEVAREIGMDPAEFKMKNLVESGEEWAAGDNMEEVRVKETLQATLEAANYYSPKAPNVGRGFAIADRGQGAGQGHCAVTLAPDGSVVAAAPIFDPGTGVYTTLAQVVAEELQIPYEDVKVQMMTTDFAPFEDGVGGSTQSRRASTVAYDAAQDVKQKLRELAADKLDWPIDSIGFRDGEIWRTDIEEKISWRELLSTTQETIVGEGHMQEATRSRYTSFNVQVIEVKVDPETGEIDILGITTGHDVGTILNEIGHQGQINGGVIMGISHSLMEDMRLEDGRVTSGSLGDYKIPTIRDIPPLKTVLVQGEIGNGPYNVKGIGELPICAAGPAIANAIQDACGVRLRDMPFTAEKLYQELKQRS